MNDYTDAWERLKHPDDNNASVRFTENGKTYLFSHSRSGKEWHLAELSGGIPSLPGIGRAMTQALTPKVLRSGSWQRFYEVLIPFTEGGRNYLFAHSSQDNRWFISELSASWNGCSELKNGNWARFCSRVVTFAEGGRNYLLAHSRQDYRWFISDLSLSWNGSSGIRSGNWDAFCDSMLAFSRNGRNYVFGHTVEGNRWFISELSTDWDGHRVVKSGITPLRDMATLPEF